ncbi:MAG: hypothetical protein EBT39_06680 [Sphingobacteriia bacterium]|jgi:hypothetical protein|nr:hypothetical protein [Candidatus Fonsibacter lacus]
MTKAQDKKIEDVMTSIYTELYAVSEPSVSWNYLVESAELNERGQKIIPYNDYLIDEEVYYEIVKRHLKELKVPKWRKEAVSRGILLGCSPKFKKPPQ